MAASGDGGRHAMALASMVQGLETQKEAWSDASRRGENRLTRLINVKMEMLRTTLGLLASQLGGRVEGKLHEQGRHYAKLLRETCQELALVHGRMEQALLPLRTMLRIAAAKGDNTAGQLAVNNTLTLGQAVSLAEELIGMYARDLHLKRLLVDDVVAQSNRDVLIVYLSAWEMMPYIDKRRQDELIDMLAPSFLPQTDSSPLSRPHQETNEGPFY